MNSRQVGQVIWDQMNAIDKNLVWCMGTNQVRIIDNGLQFKVKGFTFKGVVQIVLNFGNDTYTIKFLKMKRKQNQAAKELGVKIFDTSYETIKEFDGVYCDEMMSLLESVVENRQETA